MFWQAQVHEMNNPREIKTSKVSSRRGGQKKKKKNCVSSKEAVELELILIYLLSIKNYSFRLKIPQITENPVSRK